MTSVNREPECPYTADDDLLRRYAAGKVDGEEADRFEQHLFECDRCWNELREVAHLRSALRDRMELRRSNVARPIAPILAAAAAMVLIILGAWNLYLDRRTPDRTIWRGPHIGAITLSAVRQDSTVSIRWNSIPGASTYVVSIFAADGTLVQRVPATDTNVTVTLEPTSAAEAVYARVDAIDRARRPIAESSLQRISIAR